MEASAEQAQGNVSRLSKFAFYLAQSATEPCWFLMWRGFSVADEAFSRSLFYVVR